jgi:hypothetical protein
MGDPNGILILALVCATVGFAIGWIGGKAEGRSIERESTRS